MPICGVKQHICPKVKQQIAKDKYPHAAKSADQPTKVEPTLLTSGSALQL